MDSLMKNRVAFLVTGMGLGLLLMGALRFSATHQCLLTPLANFATAGYVLVTILFTVGLVRAGLPLGRLGFGPVPILRVITLAAAAVAIRQVLAFALDPQLVALLGEARDLERFAEVEGSVSSLASLLAVSWTFAAFGEELAYRIVLMRGSSFVLGDTRTALGVALVLQAAVFGLAHAYQGPTGIAGSAISGLVFGAVTLAGRWSIWPAALAHGVNNTIGIFELYRG